VNMALNQESTKQLRQQLRANRKTMPFFDTARWVRNFEDSMEQMFNRYIEGKRPDHIYVIDTD